MTTTTEPTQETMLQEIATRLGVEGVPADVRDLAAWVAAAWPLVEDDPDAGRWAHEYARLLRGEDGDPVP
jgi:hypothetical protein